MLGMLGKAYSAPKGDIHNVIYALAFGLFVGAFLVFFLPFDLDNAPYPNKPWSIAFFGVISTFVLTLTFYFIPRSFPGIFNDRKWKVWHQIAYLAFAIFLISTLNGLYINYIANLSFSWSNYLQIIINTFAVASIPVIVGVLWDYNRRLRQNLLAAQQLKIKDSNLSPNSVSREEQIRIMNHNQIQLHTVHEILFVEADSNYLNIYKYVDSAVQKIVVRSSLTKTELETHGSSLQRCHRSYIVNLYHVIEVGGNAQGLKLKLRNTDQVVPVSRKYIPVINAHFQS